MPFCRQCGYNLAGLTAEAPRCPECGRAFDPADPRTTDEVAGRSRRRRIKRRVGIGFGLVLLAVVGWLGGLYAGYRADRRAVALIARPGIDGDATHVSAESTLPSWAARTLGRHAWIGDRAARLTRTSRPLSDDQLAALGSLSHLRTLTLYHCGAGDETCARLAPLTGLQSLDLGENSGVSDAGVRHLVSLGALQFLNLSGTSVTDDGVAALRGLPALHEVVLSETPITRAALDHLAAMPQLRRVTLGGNPGITSAWYRSLRARRPDLTVRQFTR